MVVGAAAWSRMRASTLAEEAAAVVARRKQRRMAREKRPCDGDGAAPLPPQGRGEANGAGRDFQRCEGTRINLMV